MRSQMGRFMRTIRTRFQSSILTPIKPIVSLKSAQMILAILESDDLPPDAIADLAEDNRAFDFLNDPREDIYTESDGEPV